MVAQAPSLRSGYKVERFISEHQLTGVRYQELASELARRYEWLSEDRLWSHINNRDIFDQGADARFVSTLEFLDSYTPPPEVRANPLLIADVYGKVLSRNLPPGSPAHLRATLIAKYESLHRALTEEAPRYETSNAATHVFLSDVAFYVNDISIQLKNGSFLDAEELRALGALAQMLEDRKSRNLAGKILRDMIKDEEHYINSAAEYYRVPKLRSGFLESVREAGSFVPSEWRISLQAAVNGVAVRGVAEAGEPEWRENIWRAVIAMRNGHNPVVMSLLALFDSGEDRLGSAFADILDRPMVMVPTPLQVLMFLAARQKLSDGRRSLVESAISVMEKSNFGDLLERALIADISALLFYQPFYPEMEDDLARLTAKLVDCAPKDTALQGSQGYEFVLRIFREVLRIYDVRGIHPSREVLANVLRFVAKRWVNQVRFDLAAGVLDRMGRVADGDSHQRWMAPMLSRSQQDIIDNFDGSGLEYLVYSESHNARAGFSNEPGPSSAPILPPVSTPSSPPASNGRSSSGARSASHRHSTALYLRRGRHGLGYAARRIVRGGMRATGLAVR